MQAYLHGWQLPTHREHQQEAPPSSHKAEPEREYYCVHTHLTGSLSEASQPNIMQW